MIKWSALSYVPAKTLKTSVDTIKYITIWATFVRNIDHLKGFLQHLEEKFPRFPAALFQLFESAAVFHPKDTGKDF